MLSRICKRIVFKGVYPMIYFLGSLRKVEKQKVLFVENHCDCLSNNFELLYETLCERGLSCHTHYLKVVTSSWRQIIIRTIQMIWDMSNAGCVFLNESNSVFGAFDLRKETKLIQIWHACGAFKKWGYSVADKSFGDSRRDLELYSGHSNYTYVPVSGAAICWAYVEAFGLEDKADIVKPIGVSRTDMYFSNERKQRAYQNVQHFLHNTFGKERKIILYAPTFRGNIKNAKSPTQLQLQQFEKYEKEYILIVKQHPFVQKGYSIPKECRGFCVEAGSELSIEDLILTADICVTDYSSIVFEYSLMNKPIIFFAHDLNTYYDERGFYFPYEEFVPGPIVRTTEELVYELDNIHTYDINKITTFVAKYMNGCDGHATERIIQYALSEM